MTTIKQSKIKKAHALFKFKCERYTLIFGTLPEGLRLEALVTAARKYGVDPDEVDTEKEVCNG